MRNPRYKGEARRLCKDERTLWVTVGCGNCYECRKQKANSWRIRLCEEIKEHEYAYFITLTFSPESLRKLCDHYETTETNAVAGIALRKFLERYRKKNKHSLRHWIITELGHEGTERIHMHGIIFDKEPWNNAKLESYWQYGAADTGKYCNIQTINYIVKYVTKIDTVHKDYKAQIFASPGIGSSYLKTFEAKTSYKYRPHNSREFYTLKNGVKVGLPIYYRNKLYSEREREKLWTDRLDKGTLWCNGIQLDNINTPEGWEEYMKVLKEQQQWNKAIGYGSTDDEWKKREYNITAKMLQIKPK